MRCTSLSGKKHKQRKEDGRPVQTTGGKYKPNIVVLLDIVMSTLYHAHEKTYVSI
jgi:hypothetical protein